MKGFRIYDHTEKVGGRTKEKTMGSGTPVSRANTHLGSYEGRVSDECLLRDG